MAWLQSPSVEYETSRPAIRPTSLCVRCFPAGGRFEAALHRRFEPARIRGEWFGYKYLPVILAFGEGLAEDALEAYDESGAAPEVILDGLGFRGFRELQALRADLWKLWRDGHNSRSIAQWLYLPEEEVEFHMEALFRDWLRSRGLNERQIALRVAAARRSGYGSDDFWMGRAA